MAFLEQMLTQQQGTRAPGEPRPPAISGAPPRPSMPAQTVNPPGIAQAPVGRPPAPPSNAGPLPNIQPGGITPGGFGPTPFVGEKSKPAGSPPKSKSEVWPDLTGPAQPMMLQLGRVPSPAERASMGGFQVMTPYGEVLQDGSLVPSAEGAARYQQAMVAARQAFGPHPWSNDPMAPPPPARIGGSMFNPLSGAWSRHQG